MADTIPESQKKDVVYFGRANFRNEDRLFGIKRRDRRQHMYVIGKTGTGKSALIHNMIVQDISNGEGVCVIDPHGELIEDVLSEIPKERLKDVVYFNPADPDFHLGFNVLELPDPQYKHLAASGLMAIFTKIWSNVWSARMEYIMNNAILALLDTPGSTLLGITRILVDKDFRQKIVANVKDPVVRAFWIHEYEEWQDKFRSEAIAPIQNKVGQFLSTALIRNVVGQRVSTVNIFDIMNTRKIFLVNVSKGRIGEDNSALLGAMIITKVQLSAMERVRIPEDERKDFYMYVDEFQNFATESFASILSEARKYRLNLIIAHQYIGQLVTDMSTIVRDAVFGNVGTMVSFRVGATDAEFLEKEFEPEFTPPDIIQLPNYNIYLKLMVDGVTSRPFSAKTLPPFHLQTDSDIEEQVIEMSRKLYARPRSEVEDEINEWSGMNVTGASEGGGQRGPGGFGGQNGGGPRRDFRSGPPQQGTRQDFQQDPIPSTQPRRVDPRLQSQLAELGIEFSNVQVPVSQPRRDQSSGERRAGGERSFDRSRGPRRESPPFQQSAPSSSAPARPPMRLSDLKSQKGGNSKSDSDRSALRDALKAVLSAPVPEKKDDKPSEKTDSL